MGNSIANTIKPTTIPTTRIIIAYAARHSDKNWAMKDVMQRISIARTLFSGQRALNAEKAILEQLAADTADFLEGLMEMGITKDINLTVESFLRDKLWSEAHNLVMGPEETVGIREKIKASLKLFLNRLYLPTMERIVSF